MKAYVRDRRADELFSFGDVHVLTDCIVRTSDDEAGIYPLTGITARVDEQGDLSSHGTTLGRSLVAPGWQKTINTIATRMIIDGRGFQWIVPVPRDGR